MGRPGRFEGNKSDPCAYLRGLFAPGPIRESNLKLLGVETKGEKLVVSLLVDGHHAIASIPANLVILSESYGSADLLVRILNDAASRKP